jgi:glycerol-3-phosphate dehydrogenase
VTEGAPPHAFSAAGRSGALAAMASAGVDLLVVGGGITGCGIARDAALRGWSVGLVEKEDFGFGTSSRSSKIVHGGVRYLEYGHFLLVRESARERTVVRSIAPHLVHRLDFLYPVFAPDSLVKIKAGLSVFDWLAGAEGDDRHDNLDPAEVRERLPGLREPLKGAVRYPEYITDDARLTLENAISAAQHGALVANHAEVTGFLTDDVGTVIGATVQDRATGTDYDVAARCVVNACGPWAEQVLAGGGLPVKKPLSPSKGVHLLFSAQRLPIQGATFLKSSSGRRGLAMRRLDYVYVGTSDTPYDGSLDAPNATQEDVLDLLAMVQDCFPDAAVTADDVLATWAGVRPLIAEEGKTTRDTSREDELWHGPRGLITIAGGKLTTYRRMAARAVEEIRDVLGDPPVDEDTTDQVRLPGAPTGDAAAFAEDRGAELARAGVAPDVVARLCWLYGTQLDDILELGAADDAWLERLGPGVPAVRAEPKLAAEREMALTLVDFMDRRAALLLFSPDFGLAAAPEACAIMGDVLGWDEERRAQELASYSIHADRHRVPAV